MVGQTILHYKIIEKLGEGGMGVVYKAQDLTLDRLVALKFLPHHLTANEAEQARFLQEAKAAATLNHPNACTIYAVEEHEGQKFIAMEYVDGQTLRDLKPESLQLDKILSYAIQIGEALHEAHSKSIVHRDIKPDNIMLSSRNQIKVMDFGLAKLKGALKLTRTSSTVGTLAYMPPEQIQGGEVDARSDIFSFGVVLFEMLTGQLPFRGEHEAAMVYSIVNEEPTPIEKLRADTPAELKRIISRALEKDPEDRYQHVDDLVSELRRVKKQSTKVMRPSAVERPVVSPPGEASKPVEPQPSVGTPEPSKKRLWVWPATVVVLLGAIALYFLFLGRTPDASRPHTSRKMLVVLPFENLGPSNQEYFVDGITEEITSRLSGLSGLGVIARSSAIQYKKTTKTIKEIGEELGVSYILQGTVRWETADGATHVRVNPQLIKVADGTQIWSQPAEAVLSGVFKLQSDIAGEVASALDIALLQPEQKSLEAVPTKNPEAYDYYLRGKEYLNRSFGEQDLAIAGQMFQRAIELDPSFATAHALLSRVHSLSFWFYYDRKESRVLKSKEAAETALRLDPQLPDAHSAMGWYYYHGRLDYNNALREFDVALQNQPSNTDVLFGIAAVQRRQGKFEEAFTNFKKAVEINPRSALLITELATTASILRRYSEANEVYDRALFLSPDWSYLYVFKVFLSLAENGNISNARAALRQAAERKVRDENGELLFASLTVDIVDGKYQNALDQLVSSERDLFQTQYDFIPKSLLLAELYSYLNRPELRKSNYDSARAVLEREVRTRPEDERPHGSLGLVYAGLGRKSDAIREGKRAVELLPISKEAMRGAHQVWNLARIYAKVGESNAAIDELEKVLSMPSDFSVAWVRIHPDFSTLRDNPRLPKLLEKYK